jgi:hypothetical protein
VAVAQFYFSLRVFPKLYLHVVVGPIWSCLPRTGNSFMLHHLILFLTPLTLDRTPHDQRAILFYFGVRVDLSRLPPVASLDAPLPDFSSGGFIPPPGGHGMVVVRRKAREVLCPANSSIFIATPRPSVCGPCPMRRRGHVLHSAMIPGASKPRAPFPTAGESQLH